MRAFGKLTAMALIGALTLVGCSGKKSQSVVVSPIGGSAYGGPNHAPHEGAYTGGPLVDNSANVQQSAAALQSVVHFDFDSDVIRPDAAAVLNQHVAFLNSNQTARVQVAGHTDERGSREYNMSLGERRAAAVRAYLAGQGVNVSNVEILSFGEEQPVATGSNEAAWAQNRRAELSY